MGLIARTGSEDEEEDYKVDRNKTGLKKVAATVSPVRKANGLLKYLISTRRMSLISSFVYSNYPSDYWILWMHWHSYSEMIQANSLRTASVFLK